MWKDQFSEPIRALLADDEWLVAEEGYHPRDQIVYESIFCLASGYMGNRASAEEGFCRRTLPANYVHGVFDRSEAFQRELANTPDWCKLKMYYQCDPIAPEEGESLEGYLRVLDMKHGLVAKRYVTQAADGRRTQVEILKFLSRAHGWCGAFKVWLTPLNYGGLLEFENIIDATVTNFIDFPRFRVKHMHTKGMKALEGLGCYLESETRDFKLPVGTAAGVRIFDETGKDVLKSRAFRPYGETACEFVDAYCQEGHTLCVEKYAALCTGRDVPEAEVAAETQRRLQAFVDTGFDAELQAHLAEYARLWSRADLGITGDDRLQKALRFNIFHLMSTPSLTDNRTNIGAKLIHGEEYGGHAFWDTELFLLPFFDYVFPEVARNLVDYRYLLLDKARENAVKNGYQGAKYPWESADTGDEECPAWTIEPDGSCYRCYVADYEHHVTAAVAYGGVHYFELTGDEDFFDREGLEILCETARFWVSRLEYNADADRYEIRKVTGPDEWHEPVDNNAYTNYLARWNIRKAVEYMNRYEKEKPEVYARIAERIGLDKAELDVWAQRAEMIYLPDTSGVIEQFEGYFDLADAVIDRWDENNMPLWPESLKDVPKEKRCILKQADVVMLMYLMEHEFTPETQRLNFDYYEKRTLHRSSLSPSIHCLMGLRVGESEHAYQYLCRSAYVDIDNNQRNTREGIHAASAGGTWQCVTLGYCGMSTTDKGELCFTPHLPEQWERVRYHIRWRGADLRITVTHDGVKVEQESGTEPAVYWCKGERLTAQRA